MRMQENWLNSDNTIQMKPLKNIVLLFLFSGYMTAYGQTAEKYDSIGSVKFKNQDYKGAIEQFDKAIDLKPDYAEAYFGRGDARLMLENYPAAIKDFDQAAE